MKRALCNELFGEMSFRESLGLLRRTGFTGVEIAPHTLFGDFSGNRNRTLAEIRRTLDGEGVGFAGFHWLLVGPPDLKATAPEGKVRMKAWDHLRMLADMGGELGGGPMTFGSPAQRASAGGQSSEEATGIFIEELRSVAGRFEDAGCRLLVEALPSEFTDVVNTLAEAREVITAVARKGVGGMFDFHNTDDETEEWAGLISAHRDHISHVHLNDIGGEPPAGVRREYEEAFTALKEIGYRDWVSLEIFTVPQDPETTLRQVSDFLDHPGIGA